MSAYADTSFLFSLYVADANTPLALSFRQSRTDPFPLTEFHRLELRNAIAQTVFRKQLTAATAQATWANVEADIHNGALVLVRLAWPDVFREAESLAQRHTPATGSRSLDTLHVAAAVAAGAVDFVTFDIRQAALVKHVGLTVKP